MTDRKQFKLKTTFSSNYKPSSWCFPIFQVRQISDEGQSSKFRGKKNNFYVFNYFKTENPSLKRNVLVEMTVKATGASATSVKRIVGEKDGTKSPGKSKPERKKAFDRLDEFDLGVIRRMMHSFYARGESPTLAKMHKKLKEEINIPYQISRLRLVLKILGFQFKRKARKSIIHERPDLIMWRERYNLRRIKEIQENEPKSEIVYTDETWLNSGHKIKKEWVDLKALENPRHSLLKYGTVGTTKCSTGKGKRLIIVDCITENGPVPGALWTFSAESKPKQEKEVENQFVDIAVAQEKANEMSKTEDHRRVVNTHQMQSTSKSGKRKSLGTNESLSKSKRFKEGVKSVDEEESTAEEKQPTVQGWILHYKDFWENFHISGFLCYKFIVFVSDFTLSIWFVTSEIKRVGKMFVNSV